MSGDDDPEARIRELERALSEQAAEPTHGSPEQAWPGSPAFHGPPPSTTVTPAPSPPAAPSGSGWLRYGVMAAVLLALVGGIVVYAVNAFSSVSSKVDTNLGTVAARPTAAGGGSVGTSAAPTTIVLQPAGGTLDVPNMGVHETIACNDGNVTVSGARNTVVITGQCSSVTVSGMENLVTVNASVKISAPGMNNRVTYLSGAPQIDDPGIANTVERG